MRRPRDVALHAGFYLAATLTGIAAAYVLKEWIHHIWPPQPEPDHTSEQSSPPDQPGVPAPAPVLEPAPDPDVRSPPPALPPLRVDSLPPGALADTDSLSSPTPFTAPLRLSSPEEQEGVDGEPSSQTTSDSDSFVDVLSPHPPAQVISRRRSFFRNHDLFAESHLSFSQLGNLVAPDNDSESD